MATHPRNDETTNGGGEAGGSTLNIKRAHTGTRITQTNLTTIHPSIQTHQHTTRTTRRQRDDQNRGRLKIFRHR